MIFCNLVVTRKARKINNSQSMSVEKFQATKNDKVSVESVQYGDVEISLNMKLALFATINKAFASTQSQKTTDVYRDIVARVLTEANEVAYIINTKGGDQQILPVKQLLKTHEGAWMVRNYEAFTQLRLDREYYLEHLRFTYESDASKKHMWLAIANFQVVAEGMDYQQVYNLALSYPTVLAPKMIQVGCPIRSTMRR